MDYRDEWAEQDYLDFDKASRRHVEAALENRALLRESEDRIDLVAAREALLEPGSSSWEAVKKRLGL